MNSREFLNMQAQGATRNRPPATVFWAAIVWMVSIALEHALLVFLGVVDKGLAQSFGGGATLWNAIPRISTIAAILALAMPLALFFRIGMARRIALFLGAAIPLFVLASGLFGMIALGTISDMVSKTSVFLAILVLPATPVWAIRPLLHSKSAKEWYLKQP